MGLGVTVRFLLFLDVLSKLSKSDEPRYDSIRAETESLDKIMMIKMFLFQISVLRYQSTVGSCKKMKFDSFFCIVTNIYLNKNSQYIARSRLVFVSRHLNYISWHHHILWFIYLFSKKGLY